MPRGDRCWMRWYGNLHDWLVREDRDEVTRDINDGFRTEVGTDETVEAMQKLGFWRSWQPGVHPDWSSAWRSGIDVIFAADADGLVRRVTFRRM